MSVLQARPSHDEHRFIQREVALSLLRFVQDQVSEVILVIAERQDNCIVGAAVNACSCPWVPDKFVEFARRCECGPTRDVIEFWAYVTSKPNL